MTTEATLNDSEVCAFVVGAIQYLERNDFTDISQIGLRLLCALDGRRGVYFWLDSTCADHAIPMKLVDMARQKHYRIDILTIDSNSGLLLHQMNAVEA